MIKSRRKVIASESQRLLQALNTSLFREQDICVISINLKRSIALCAISFSHNHDDGNVPTGKSIHRTRFGAGHAAAGAVHPQTAGVAAVRTC